MLTVVRQDTKVCNGTTNDLSAYGEEIEEIRSSKV